MFTLIHELTHIFIGDEEILGQQDSLKYYDKTEAFVNKINTEILNPKGEKCRILHTMKKKGVDYRNNLDFRVDRNFFKYVENALHNQSISYTDAFNLVGVGYKEFQCLKQTTTKNDLQSHKIKIKLNINKS